MPLTRRDLLRSSALGAGALALGNVGALFTAPGSALAATVGGYGRIMDDPAGLLDLAKGFRYRIISEVGDPLRGGGFVPDAFDGTGAFAAPSGGTLLVRNHEQSTSGTPKVVGPAAVTYDPGAAGGTTTLKVDAHGVLLDEYVSLAGTNTNCAGGVTPWGTWLTCEETEAKAGGALTRDHGFVFEVDPVTKARNATPFPLKAMGRFAHEAVAIDPRTNFAYLTEDAGSPNGLLYRFVPTERTARYGAYRKGGTLTAMLCKDNGQVVTDLSVYRTPGKRLSVQWVPIADPQAASVSVRKQFQWTGDPANVGGPITRSRKFEGTWYGNGRIYVVTSFARLSDGSLAEHDGQVWSYDPATASLRLELRLALNTAPSGNGADKPDGPDNMTVNPHGGLMLAEDGSGVQHLLTVSPDGTTSVFARNARDDGEFTGVCFSPDGKTMFANLQKPGVTFAITGPFANAH
jgi:secreted PhoX family phosphatase